MIARSTMVPTAPPAVRRSAEAGEAETGGLIMRMRNWFTAIMAGARLSDSDQSRDAVMRLAFGPGDGSHGSSTVVPFPLSEHARLAQLGRLLRTRLADDGGLFLDIAQTDGGYQLRIDGTASAEIQGGRYDYRVTLLDAFGSKLTLETADAETVCQFVGHYVIAKLADAGGRGGDQ